MRKVLLGIGFVVILTGCATDGIYGVGKTGVQIGRAVIDITGTEVSNDVKEAYHIAKDYDTVRGLVRDEIAKKPLNVDTPSIKIE